MWNVEWGAGNAEWGVAGSGLQGEGLLKGFAAN
jgi:hypothetical protein